MGIIKFKAEKNEGFNYEEGFYEAVIASFEESKNNSGKLQYVVKFTGESFGAITLYMQDNAFGYDYLYKMAIAIGDDPDRDDFDTADFIDAPVKIHITKQMENGKERLYNGKPTYQVSDILPLDEDIEEDEDVEEEEDGDNPWS